MSTPQDPFGRNPSGGDPFGGAAFGHAPAPQPTAPPAPVPRPPANTLATLSVIFAFVFTPAGALLGHLGLSQIRRTGQPGRGRALIGLVASYTVIAVAVVAVAISTTTPATKQTASHPGPAAPTSSAVPVAPAPGAHVAPDDLAALLPNQTQIEMLTNDFSLTLQFDVGELTTAHREGVIDRIECQGLLVIGDARVYDTRAVRGMHLSDYIDMSDGFTLEPVQAVAAYDDAVAARAARDTLLSGWRRCEGTDYHLNFNGKVLNQHAGVAADAGHGITTITTTTTNAVSFTARAIAVKANVVVDVLVGAKTDQAALAVTIANAILAKIPDS